MQLDRRITASRKPQAASRKRRQEKIGEESVILSEAKNPRISEGSEATRVQLHMLSHLPLHLRLLLPLHLPLPLPLSSHLPLGTPRLQPWVSPPQKLNGALAPWGMPLKTDDPVTSLSNLKTTT
jgi:hypothetical protein